MLDGELRRQKGILAATDATALVGAVSLAWVTHKPFGGFCPLKPGGWTGIAAGLIGLVAIWIVTAKAMGLYRPRHGRVDELIAIVKAACVTWLAAVVLRFFCPSGAFPAYRTARLRARRRVGGGGARHYPPLHQILLRPSSGDRAAGSGGRKSNGSLRARPDRRGTDSIRIPGLH